MQIASSITGDSEKENLALFPSNETDNNVSCKIILSSRWFIHDNHDFLSTINLITLYRICCILYTTNCLMSVLNYSEKLIFYALVDKILDRFLKIILLISIQHIHMQFKLVFQDILINV